MRVYCNGEILPSGGPGTFLLDSAENTIDFLLPKYAGKIQLIYLDPPFGTGDTFSLRLNASGKTIKVPVYSDTMKEEEYNAWFLTVLEGCSKLLKPSGSIYVHIDYRKSAVVRLMMDNIFGEKNFMNEIIWSYKSGGRSIKYYPRKHDTILFYRKSAAVFFDLKAIGKPRGPEKRNHMKRFIDDDGRICFSIRSGGKTYYYYEDTPVYPTDVWTDIEHLQQKDAERTGYATQKPEALIKRIILSSSRPGDTVLDLFAGSGTTASVAFKEKREYITGDISGFSMNTFRSRILKDSSKQQLTEASHDTVFKYPTYNGVAGIEYDMDRKENKVNVFLKRAEFDGVYPISYAALGKKDSEGYFHPEAIAASLKLPCKLKSETGSNVLEISDAQGKTAFFELV